MWILIFSKDTRLNFSTDRLIDFYSEADYDATLNLTQNDTPFIILGKGGGVSDKLVLLSPIALMILLHHPKGHISLY